MNEKLDQIVNEKYINLETYKKDGTPIQTPVWFVMNEESMYVITKELTGKVKRLRNNPKVKFAVCGFKGEVHGEWISATTEIIEGQQAKDAIKLRKKKYGFRAMLVGAVTKAKGEPVVYSVSIDSK